jgi:hypothetical protein
MLKMVSGIYLVHALFAINEKYPLGDKRALKTLDSFDYCPPGAKDILDKVLGHGGMKTEELKMNTAMMKGLWKEVVVLTKGAYQSKF